MLGLVLLLMVAPGTAKLGLYLLEEEGYVEFIYLTIYPSIARKRKQGGNGYIRRS